MQEYTQKIRIFIGSFCLVHMSRSSWERFFAILMISSKEKVRNGYMKGNIFICSDRAAFRGLISLRTISIFVQKCEDALSGQVERGGVGLGFEGIPGNEKSDRLARLRCGAPG